MTDRKNCLNDISETCWNWAFKCKNCKFYCWNLNLSEGCSYFTVPLWGIKLLRKSRAKSSRRRGLAGDECPRTYLSPEFPWYSAHHLPITGATSTLVWALNCLMSWEVPLPEVCWMHVTCSCSSVLGTKFKQILCFTVKGLFTIFTVHKILYSLIIFLLFMDLHHVSLFLCCMYSCLCCVLPPSHKTWHSEIQIVSPKTCHYRSLHDFTFALPRSTL